MRRLVTSFALLLTAAVGMAAQAPCAVLSPYTPPAGRPMLSLAQEQWLWTAMRAQTAGRLDPIADPQLNREVQRVLARLVAKLPPLGMPVDASVVDFDEANALTLPGGHIIVTRPLIALMRNEDELAAVLAHELGHVYTRADAASFASDVHNALHVTSYGDTESAFLATYQLWMTWQESHGSRDNDTIAVEEQADQAGLQILEAAGYDLHAMSDMFDRTAGLNGSTGSWFSNMFGGGSTDAQRLRGMIAALHAPAQACPAPAATSAPAFAAWQSAVAAWVQPDDAPQLPGLITREQLPPLTSSFAFLRFSPDGTHILGMNGDGAWVLTRDPLAVALHVIEPRMMNASFTADGTGIVFSTDDERVERWDIASRKLVALHQVAVAIPGCLYSQPSPDGADLGCLRDDGSFALLDVVTGAVRYERKTAVPVGALVMAVLNRAALHFSSNGRYLAVTPGVGGVVLDLATGQPLHLGGEMSSFLNPDFEFLGDGEALGTNDPYRKQWKRLSFPAGKSEASYELGNVQAMPETRGPLVLIRPMGIHPAGAIDPLTRKIAIESVHGALDGDGTTFVVEGERGEVALLDASGAALREIGALDLPNSRLAYVNEGEASPDLRLLTLSEAQRGALWDVSQNQLLAATAGLHNAWFGADEAGLWLQYGPAREQGYVAPPGANNGYGKIVQYDLRGGLRHDTPTPPRGELDELAGAVTIVYTPGGKPLSGKLPVEFRDTATGTKLWSQTFNEGDIPHLQLLPDQKTLLLAYRLNDPSARRAAEADTRFTAALAQVHDRNEAGWIELRDARTGRLEHSFLLWPAPYLLLNASFLLGSHLYLYDGNQRTLAYDVTTGQLAGIWFGRGLDAEVSRGTWLNQPTQRELTLYRDGATEPIARYHFPQEVVFAQASTDGTRLLAVTADEIAYTLALPSTARP